LTKKEFDSFFIGYPFKSCDSCAKEPQSAICDHGSLKRVCYICELQEEIAALREENERLKEELKVTRHYLKHHQENSDRLINEVDRLRANAIVWHKWPENEAPEQVRCLAKDVNGSVYIGEYLPTRGMSDWLLDGFDWRDPAVIVAYAEIPGPEGK
jgi:uncharacterized small protein (DUF1192 family)